MSFLNGSISAASSDPPAEIDTPYNYIPTQSVTIAFVSLFATSTVFHLGSAICYRLWWLLPTAVLAGIGETIGWSGRLWSSINVENNDAFMIQICCTIVSPTFLLAAVFIIFSRLSQQLGACYGRLPPTWYARIFLTCDIVALIVQGTGGGIASSADTLAGANRGGNIMLGGIIFQLIVLVLFMILAGEFFVRSATDRPIPSKLRNDSTATLYSAPMWTRRLIIMSAALGFMTLVLLIRSIYRTIELADGWNGRIISTEVYFNVLDGAMIVLATYTLNIFHPGRLLYSESPVQVDVTEVSDKNNKV